MQEGEEEDDAEPLAVAAVGDSERALPGDAN
jgi:hypothetical protein